MITALINVAEGMIFEQGKYLSHPDNMDSLDTISRGHEQAMRRINAKLQAAIAAYQVEAISDAKMIEAIVEYHMEVSNEMISWTQEVAA